MLKRFRPKAIAVGTIPKASRLVESHKNPLDVERQSMQRSVTQSLCHTDGSKNTMGSIAVGRETG